MQKFDDPEEDLDGNRSDIFRKHSSFECAAAKEKIGAKSNQISRPSRAVKTFSLSERQKLDAMANRALGRVMTSSSQFKTFKSIRPLVDQCATDVVEFLNRASKLPGIKNLDHFDVFHPTELPNAILDIAACVETSGNGSCYYNGISIVLVGDETLSTMLRLCVLVTILQEEQSFRNILRRTGEELLPGWQNELINQIAATHDSVYQYGLQRTDIYADQRIFFVAAHMLKRDIYIVQPFKTIKYSRDGENQVAEDVVPYRNASHEVLVHAAQTSAAFTERIIRYTPKHRYYMSEPISLYWEHLHFSAMVEKGSRSMSDFGFKLHRIQM